jgi:putative selenate reductase
MLGPAAGPHTQLAQNILSAWLTGARYFETKTVQKLDRLTVEKPCIDAADEGYNTEWSTELTLDQAYDEYLKAWFLLHVLDPYLNPGSAPGPFSFAMSVGYDLEGIKTPAMDRFIERLKDSAAEPLFHTYRVQPRICVSVTLSTMHGCPPGEIEAICGYLIEEKGLDTLVKLNPTLLGYKKVKQTLAGLGFGYVSLNEEGFAKDLRYRDAIPMLSRLRERARKAGRSFGVKLSNTLAAANTRGVLPGKEMYMSGRALYPLTVSLAAALAEEFHGGIPISFSGGVSAWNLSALLDAGIGPLTLATDLLKPGGYTRLNLLARIVDEHAARAGSGTAVAGPDAEKLRKIAEDALRDPRFRKEFRGITRVAVEGPLPLWDCFTATCSRTCPIEQDVPEYIRLAGAGRFSDALAVIHEKNPLPFITGYLCDHRCTLNCARLDWEGAVRIRDMKRICAEKGYAEFREKRLHLRGKAEQRGVKAAIVGAGPAGLAAAAFLAREGFEAHLFEREREPGGVVRYLLPGFRVPADAVEKDISLIRDLGIVFHFGAADGLRVNDLKSRGFRYVLLAIGAESGRGIGIEGGIQALDFLKQYRADPSGPRLGKRVAVIGAGDTAMDAARAAKRCPGVQEVRILYRRSQTEMPASREEYEAARDEGIRFDFLMSPEKRFPGRLVCRVMEMGAADASGRARPVPTPRTRIIQADSVIAAAGAEPDARALARLGLDPARLGSGAAVKEAGPDGVFLIGDAAQGAQTIVKAIASARRAVEDISAREGGIRRRSEPLPRGDLSAIRARRNGAIPTSPADADDWSLCGNEAARCLSCGMACLKCVEVCPNRANTVVEAPGFRDAVQIVHLDAPCNECGNCATFCPWNGKPYKDKLTVYAGEKEFAAGGNPGFYLQGLAGKLGGKLRLDGSVRDIGTEFIADESSNILPTVGDDRVRAVISAILRDRPYLLGGSS